MKIKTIYGRDVVLPFLGWTKVKNFENIGDEKKAELEWYFNEIGKSQTGEQLYKGLQNLSEYMQQSDDLCLCALGSQIGLTNSFMKKYRMKY